MWSSNRPNLLTWTRQNIITNSRPKSMKKEILHAFNIIMKHRILKCWQREFYDFYFNYRLFHQESALLTWLLASIQTKQVSRDTNLAKSCHLKTFLGHKYEKKMYWKFSFYFIFSFAIAESVYLQIKLAQNVKCEKK